MIPMSSRASPGGSSALRTRCTRRSLLVTVPSDSHQLARRREDDVGELAGLRQEDVLHDQACSSSCSSCIGAMLIGFGLRRILADDVERCRARRVRSLRTSRVRFYPALGRQCGAPRALELRAALPGPRRFGRPDTCSGIAPMSPPPCTLFWPRSGQTPDP